MCIEKCSSIELSPCEHERALKADNVASIADWRSSDYASTTDQQVAGKWQRRGKRLVVASALLTGSLGLVGASQAVAEDCVDSDGDGYGWNDEVQATCSMGDASVADESVVETVDMGSDEVSDETTGEEQLFDETSDEATPEYIETQQVTNEETPEYIETQQVTNEETPEYVGIERVRPRPVPRLPDCDFNYQPRQGLSLMAADEICRVDPPKPKPVIDDDMFPHWPKFPDKRLPCIDSDGDGYGWVEETQETCGMYTDTIQPAPDAPEPKPDDCDLELVKERRHGWVADDTCHIVPPLPWPSPKVPDCDFSYEPTQRSSFMAADEICRVDPPRPVPVPMPTDCLYNYASTQAASLNSITDNCRVEPPTQWPLPKVPDCDFSYEPAQRSAYSASDEICRVDPPRPVPVPMPTDCLYNYASTQAASLNSITDNCRVEPPTQWPLPKVPDCDFSYEPAQRSAYSASDEICRVDPPRRKPRPKPAIDRLPHWPTFPDKRLPCIDSDGDGYGWVEETQETCGMYTDTIRPVPETPRPPIAWPHCSDRRHGESFTSTLFCDYPIARDQLVGNWIPDYPYSPADDVKMKDLADQEIVVRTGV